LDALKAAMPCGCCNLISARFTDDGQLQYALDFAFDCPLP